MINPQITTAASTNISKSDLKQGEKATSTSSALRESLLGKALGKNLAPTTNTQALTSSDESLNLKLKSLVNKVLDQLFAKQTPNQRLAAQQERLNFAPNFSNELKTLATQMQKSPALSELAGKLEAILKPASEVKAENFAPLFKNSGVFFEAKLKDALNESSLPRSFHSLLNAIKSLSSPQISAQIVELADKDLNPKASLDELKGILSAQKGENQAQLGSTNFKTLLALGEKLENFKNYISKNPQNAQNKLPQIAASILKGLQRLETGFKQELSRPENLALKDTSVLKELNQAFFKLTNTLKALINGESIATQRQNLPNLPNLQANQNAQSGKNAFFETKENAQNSAQNSANKANSNANLGTNSALLENESLENTNSKNPTLNSNESKANLNDKSPALQDFDESPTLSKPTNSGANDTKNANLNENKPSNSAQNAANADESEIQTTQGKNETAQKGDTAKDNPKQNALNSNDSANKTQESPKNSQNLQGKENAANSAKNTTQNAVNSNTSQANSAQQNATQNQPNAANSANANSANSNLSQANSNQNPQNSPNLNQANLAQQNAANSPNFANLSAQENAQNEQAKFSQNQVKNLVFADENAQMPELEALNKELSALARKAGEGLKQLDAGAQNAKQNLNDIRNLERKIEQASRDLSKIAPKNAAELNESLKNDIKSTLLQTSQLAKSEGNEAVANQANRMLAQIEFNQLMSLANDSINTYLPLFWEDLSESRVIFKRGKKDKYYAQIKLNFAKLGELDILIALKQDKYLDINIMAEDSGFRRRIYEHSHELRRALSKAGLLSSNLFVGDIVRSKLAAIEPARDYDFEMGIDKRA